MSLHFVPLLLFINQTKSTATQIQYGNLNLRLTSTFEDCQDLCAEFDISFMSCHQNLSLSVVSSSREISFYFVYVDFRFKI